MHASRWFFLTALCLLLAAQGTYLYGQFGRASITGIVQDATGAVVPGVAVVATGVQTQLKYETTTNEVGNYTIGSLPVGEYTVTFSTQGFKSHTSTGVNLTSGQIARLDVTMEVGQVVEQVSVTAETPLLQTETAQASKAVDANIFKNLPLTFGAEGRNMAEFASKLVPGVNRSRWDMSIEGTPAATASIVIDGLNNLAGYLPGDFAEASISPEAVQEMTVFTGNVTAEFGRTAGGALNFVLKSGSNDIHGSALYYLRNEILNANDWNNNRMLAADPDFKSASTRNFVRPQHRRQDFGGSIGGPVYIPKIYDGRDKSFFHVTLERFRRHESGPTTLIKSVPQPEMFDGNLSRLLTSKQVGTDPLGRPVYQGQIYDPASLRQVGGVFVADPFLGNIIPKDRISKVATNFKSIFNEYYPPVTSDLANNLYWTRFYDQTITQFTVKGDHAFSPNHKLQGFYYQNGLPRLMEDQGGLWSLKDPELGGPLSRAFKQHRRGYNWNVAYDWIISPAMLNHASFGSNTNWAGDYSRHAGSKDHINWGIKGVGLGRPDEEVSQPVFNLGSSTLVTFEGWGVPRDSDRLYRSYVIADTVSWQVGAHALKFGGEWSRMLGRNFNFNNSGGTFNFEARTTAIPGQSYTSQIGHSFASFLLGQVNSANLSPPFNPNVHRDYMAMFIQDTWKVTPRLTLNIGLRWSGNGPVYEKDDQMANFNPNLPDPNGGNLKGAVEYMGFGAGRAGKRSVADGYWKDFGPSFGFSFRVTDKVVMRGGYGISHTPESFSTIGTWGFIPGGFAAGFQQVNSVEADSAGIYRPVFNIDNGYPGQTQAPNLDISWGQKRASVRIFPDYTKTGYVQHFSFGFQTEVTRDLLVELDWRASKGTRLHAGAGTMVLPNQIRAEELSRGAVLGQYIDSPEKAAVAGLPYPYAGWKGLGANTLMPFPQISTQSLTAKGDTVGFSTYHAGNLIVTKRFSQGFMIYGAYTLSKTITNVRDIISWYPVSIQDTYNRRQYKAISADDRTHFFKSSLMWELPMGKGKKFLGNAHPVVNALVGNWAVSAILNYMSGTPLATPNSRKTPVGWNGGPVFANFASPAGGFTNTFNPDTFNPWNSNDPGNRAFDPSLFSDALTQQLGNAPMLFPTFRNLWTWNEDVSIMKRFPIRERLTLELRVELLNAFNRHFFGGIDTNMNNSYFGSIRTASGARTGQFGMRLDW